MTTQVTRDAQWQQILDLAQETVDLPVEEREWFLAGQALDREMVNQVLELAREFERETELRAGAHVGRFQVIGELARGGTGQVYTATDTDLGRTVAIKVLDADTLHGVDAAEFLLREARTVSVLNHPNIVTVYEVIRTEATVALAMEFVPGRPVGRAPEVLDPKHCFAVCAQVAQALEAAHQNGIVHRDIKPDNIMVRPDGHVKVLDFGLAHSLRGVGEGSQVSAGMFAGTPRYMSPEQCGALHAGTASDVFSLGIVLYEMLTQVHPFDAGSVTDTMEAIQSRTPVAPSRLVPAIGKRAEALILAMLAKRAEDRPTARQVAEELRALENATGTSLLPLRARTWMSETLSTLASWLVKPRIPEAVPQS